MKPQPNRFQFTEKNVASYKPPADVGDHYAYDTETKGLSIRSQYGVGKLYVMRYSVGGKARKLRLGEVGAVALVDVRKQARAARSQVEHKIDPVNERAKLSAAAGITFKPAYDGFLEKIEAERSANYLDFTKRYLELHFKKLHGLALSTIEQSAVSAVLDTISKERGPVSMNRARAAGSAFYTWARAKGWCSHNPFEYTNKNEENGDGRERTLTARELKTLWHKLPENDYGRILKLLMLTCCRRTEIGSLQRSEINLDEKLIELPGKWKVGGRWERRTKNGRPHAVPLSPPALKILKEADGEGEFVFGRCEGRPFTGWSKSKMELDATVKIPDWTLHDLRRTGESAMGALRPSIPPHVIDAVMNHVSTATSAKKGIRKIYNKEEYLDEKTDALNRYAKWLMEVVA